MPVNAADLSREIQKRKSAILSCKFVVGCEDFFGISVQSIDGLWIMGYGNSTNLPLTLPSPLRERWRSRVGEGLSNVILRDSLPNLRYQRHPRLKIWLRRSRAG